MSLLTTITETYATLGAMSRNNPVVAGAVSLWGLGVLTYVVRNIPRAIWGFLARQGTTTLTVLSSDPIYYDLLRWMSKEKVNGWTRSFSFSRGKLWTWGGESMMAIGYGRQFFRLGARPMVFVRRQVEANATAETKEVVTITALGRNQKVFERLFETVHSQDEKKLYTNIMTWKDGHWHRRGRQYRRDLKTVTIPEATRDGLVAYLQDFIDKKQWFINNGIPWRTGILLKGPPGTGKTSLIKALCAKFDSDLYLLDLLAMSNTTLRDALSSVPEGAIVAMEDLDAARVGARNPNKKDSDERPVLGEKLKKNDDEEDRGGLTLSGLLNAIDGPASGEGRILIATTNDLESLDEALIREGRFDLKVEVGYMLQPEFRLYMKRFYPDFDTEKWLLHEDTPPCKVQALVFQHRDDPLAVVRKLCFYDVSE